MTLASRARAAALQQKLDDDRWERKQATALVKAYFGAEAEDVSGEPKVKADGLTFRCSSIDKLEVCCSDGKWRAAGCTLASLGRSLDNGI